MATKISSSSSDVVYSPLSSSGACEGLLMQAQARGGNGVGKTTRDEIRPSRAKAPLPSSSDVVYFAYGANMAAEVQKLLFLYYSRA